MTDRDYAAERYNRRTRAIERQAKALEDIASALAVSALAATASVNPHTADGSTRAWTADAASELMNQTIKAARRLT